MTAAAGLTGAEQVAQQAIWGGLLFLSVVVICFTVYKVMTKRY